MIVGESVPAQEKVVVIFEEHTDIIRKDLRDTYYGYKICVTGGYSKLILGCVVLEGNPTDSELTEMMLDRQEDIYDHPSPLQAAFDGGVTSHANLEKAKANSVKYVCFSKGRDFEEEAMCRSRKVYKILRKFRAGIESGISGLKRSFELDKCTWNVLKSFKSSVWTSIVSANLLTITRKQLA
jgi:transposase, IS5 family